MTVDTASARRVGRPRAGRIEQQVLDATTEMLVEHEPAGAFSMSDVVRRSGVSRAAIYRRWASRDELIAAALDRHRRPVVVPHTGDLLADLIEARRGASVESTAADHARHELLLRIRLVLGLQNPGLQREYWEHHVVRRRGPLTARLQAAVDAGQLREGLDLDVVLDLINGVYYYHLVVRGESLDEPQAHDRVNRAVELVLASLRP